MKNIFIFLVLSCSLFAYTLPEGAKEIDDPNFMNIQMLKDTYRINIIQGKKDYIPYLRIIVLSNPINEYLDTFNLIIGDYMWSYSSDVKILNAPNNQGIYDHFIIKMPISTLFDLYGTLKYVMEYPNDNKSVITFTYSEQEYEGRIPNPDMSQDAEQLIKDLYSMILLYKEIIF